MALIIIYIIWIISFYNFYANSRYSNALARIVPKTETQIQDKRVIIGFVHTTAETTSKTEISHKCIPRMHVCVCGYVTSALPANIIQSISTL